MKIICVEINRGLKMVIKKNQCHYYFDPNPYCLAHKYNLVIKTLHIRKLETLM